MSQDPFMNKEHLNTFIRLGEGFTVEFKRSGTSNVGRELCAFANATGGTLLIGVTDNGKGVVEGASSQQLSRDEIREFFFREGISHFDEMVCDRFSLDRDLTESVYRQFARKAKIVVHENLQGEYSGSQEFYR